LQVFNIRYFLFFEIVCSFNFVVDVCICMILINYLLRCILCSKSIFVLLSSHLCAGLICQQFVVIFFYQILFCNVFILFLLTKSYCCPTLEPFFNAVASQFVLGQQIPFTLWLSLLPVVLGKKQDNGSLVVMVL
jgi:hypothetical protein